jgi:dipeptidyl aminopeptidase/acylaminoacyl peptidase
MSASRRIFRAGFLCTVLLLGAARPSDGASAATAEPEAAFTRAVQFLRWNAEQQVYQAPDGVHWIDAGRFWYTAHDEQGRRFFVSQAPAWAPQPAFDHSKVAHQLGELLGCHIAPGDLPFNSLVPNGRDFFVHFLGECSPHATPGWAQISADGATRLAEPPVEARTDWSVSPDHRWALRIHDYNLFRVDLADMREQAITQDGARDFYHAARADIEPSEDARRWWGAPPDVISGKWSPDSKRFMTFQVDIRHVPETFVTDFQSPRPRPLFAHQPLPEDADPPHLLPYIVDAGSGRRIAVNLAPIAYLFDIDEQVQWSEDGRLVFVLLLNRGEERAEIYRVNAQTGAATRIFAEDSNTFIQMAAHGWRVLNDARTLLWTSDAEGWTALYRVDLPTGRRRKIAGGPWDLKELASVDEKAGWIYFTVIGRERKSFPYATQLCRARLDGSNMRILTPEPVNHDISMAPGGATFASIDGFYDTPPALRLRRADGKLLTTVTTADARRLLASGWSPPEAVETPSADGRSTVYGLLFTPSAHQPSQKLPLIDLIYPGGHAGPIRVWGFTTDQSSNPRALAELGFAVLMLQGPGTPLRGAAFQRAWWGDLGNLGLANHVAAIRSLASRRTDIDLGRVGILGYSAGGDAAARAIFTYPDVFRAAVSVSGSYDYRSITARWPEKYQGLFQRHPDGTDNYPIPTYQLAGRLQGKLLVASGGHDDNVNPAIVTRMVQALTDASADFSYVVVPDNIHWPFENPSFMSTMWKFLLKNVALDTPPERFAINAAPWSASDAP